MKLLVLTLAVPLLLQAIQATVARADPAQPEATLTGHSAAVVAVAFSPDGKRLASVDSSGVLKVWDPAARKELASVDGMAQNACTAQFTPDGKKLYVLSNRGLHVWDVTAGKGLDPLATPDLPSGPTAFDLAPDGKTVAVVGRSALRIYDLATGAATYAYEIHANYGIPAVAYGPDSARVATASTDHTSLVVEVATGKIPNTLDIHLNGEHVLFTRDGKSVITSASDGVVRLFDLATGEGKTLIESGGVKTMALTPDGKQLLIGGPGRAPVFVSLPDGKRADPAYDSPNFVYSAALSPDGAWLAGGSNEGSVYLWKTH